MTKAKLSHIFWMFWYVLIMVGFFVNVALVIANDLLREILKGMK